jgi:hypothetical protein
VNAELSCFVARRSDYPASFSATANRDRQAPQRRIIAYLDRGVKTVGIDMDNLAWSGIFVDGFNFTLAYLLASGRLLGKNHASE